VLALFALGLMAKPMLVTLPFVLLLLDYWPLGRKSLGWWRRVVEKLPLLALSALSCVATSLAQAAAINGLDKIPLSLRIVNALVAYADYVRQLFYPAGLVVFYPYEGSNLPVWKVAAALASLVCLSVGAVHWRRKCPYLLVGWCWYLGMLVPVIGLVQVGQQSMADRYTYLPQIGLAIAATWGAKRLLGSWRYGNWLLGVLSVLVVGVLIGCARQQVSYWRDSETLWTRDLAFVPSNAVAHVNLGVTLYEQGYASEAVEHYQKALQVNPLYTEVYTNLGNALSGEGKDEEAIVQYKKALTISPDNAVACSNLGLSLYNLGRLDEAVSQFLHALRIDPDHAETHNNLGDALDRQGKLDEAIAEYRRAAEIKPDYGQAYYNLGFVLFQQHHVAEAIAQYQKALQLEFDEVPARVQLGIALSAQGRVDDAISQFQQALKIQPDDVDARRSLAVALYKSGKPAEAITQWNEILRLQPDNAFVLAQLAHALATSPEASVRDGAKAVELARRAEKLTDGRQPLVLDALAAAQAESGQFAEAVDTAQQALALASSQNNAALAEELRARIKLYQNRSPYHDDQHATLPSEHP
jgi:tetratricopeptide (TPR) repeat protein